MKPQRQPAAKPVVRHSGDAMAHPVGGGAVAVWVDSEATAGRLGVIEQTVAPEHPGPPLHTHPDFDELFYVLDGTPEFCIGDERVAAAPGSVVFVPYGTPHTFSNPSRQPARLMIVVSPGGFERYFKALIASSPPGGKSLTETELAALRVAYGSMPAPLIASLTDARPDLAPGLPE